jgi:hypothetical protein
MGIVTNIQGAVRGRAASLGPKALVAVGVGSAAVGTIAAGRRDSVGWQTLSYAGAMGVFGGALALGAGKLVGWRAGRAAAAQVAAGAIDAATGAEQASRAMQAATRPGRVMLGASGGVFVGSLAGQRVIASTQDAVLRRVEEHGTTVAGG